MALKPISRKPAPSLLNMRKKLCLKIEVANESDRTMTPFVEFGMDFISNSPTWSKQPAKRSITWPLFDALLPSPS